MSTFHTPDSIIERGVIRDDSLPRQIRIVATRSMRLAVSCTCSNKNPFAIIENDAEAWAAWRAFHELDSIQQTI